VKEEAVVGEASGEASSEASNEASSGVFFFFFFLFFFLRCLASTPSEIKRAYPRKRLNFISH
jgi:predicted PurR-regulated permease PerM